MCVHKAFGGPFPESGGGGRGGAKAPRVQNVQEGGSGGAPSVEEALAGLLPAARRAPHLPVLHAVHLAALLGLPPRPPAGRGDKSRGGGHTRTRGDRVGHDGDGSPGHGRWLGRWRGGDSGGHRWRPRRGPAALEREDTAPVRQGDEGAQQPHLHPCPCCTPVPLTWYAWSVWTWQRPGGAGGLQGEARARSRIGSAGGGGASGPGKAGGTEEVGETGVRLESPSVSASTSTSSSV